MKTPTPWRNALFAAIYIALIVSVISSFESLLGAEKETIVIPMVMLSLLVLSAAIMGYLFVFEPARMYLEGKKQEAITFFGKTIGYFACCALVFVLLMIVTQLR